jgi:hypothetical protein
LFLPNADISNEPYPYDGVSGYGSFEISALGRNKNLKYSWSKSLGAVAFNNEFKINRIK